ncbi:MAG: hypothetical protein M3535_04155 [Actinomycetota bacterium]|nr:hypothetical protein [Actinomycetota bacterium]
MSALIAAGLRRDLSPVEDAVVGWAVAHVSTGPGPTPTLLDVARLLADPTPEMAERARAEPAELARSVDAARFALGKLLDRDLRGMFDGPTTTSVGWSGRGVVIDLSAVHQDPEALTLVMIAAKVPAVLLQALPGLRREQHRGGAPDLGPPRPVRRRQLGGQGGHGPAGRH